MRSDDSFVSAGFRSGALSTWRMRSTTALFSVPFVFTQTGILSASALVAEAKTRGWKISEEALVVLADAGLFVPLFELTDEPDEALVVDSTAGICDWPFEAHVRAKQICDPTGKKFDRARLHASRCSRWQLL